MKATGETPPFTSFVPSGMKLEAEKHLEKWVAGANSSSDFFSRVYTSCLLIKAGIGYDGSNLIVPSSLNLNDDKRLEVLPDNLVIEGKLEIKRCMNLRELPSNLLVKEDLHANACKQLKATGPNLTVGGNAILRGCHSLVKISKGTTVKKSLDIARCLNLQQLEPDTYVGVDLRCHDCNSLTRLSKQTYIGGNLYLIRCISFTDFPNLELRGSVDMQDCTSFRSSLPSSILRLPHIGTITETYNLGRRQINLSNTGLSDQEIQQMQYDYSDVVTITNGIES